MVPPSGVRKIENRSIGKGDFHIMTLIAAIRDGGKIAIAGDSLVTISDGPLYRRKIFISKNEMMVAGYAGDSMVIRDNRIVYIDRVIQRCIDEYNGNNAKHIKHILKDAVYDFLPKDKDYNFGQLLLVYKDSKEALNACGFEIAHQNSRQSFSYPGRKEFIDVYNEEDIKDNIIYCLGSVDSIIVQREKRFDKEPIDDFLKRITEKYISDSAYRDIGGTTFLKMLEAKNKTPF